MSALDSFNLGDFLRIREEDENRRRVDSLNSLAGLTLNDIILSEKRAQDRIGRTLLDVIGAPEPGHEVGEGRRDRNSQMEKERRSWKAIRDRLWLRRNGAVLNSPDVGLHRQSDSGSNRRASGELGPDYVSAGSRTGSNRQPANLGGPADASTSPRNSRTRPNLRSVTPAGPAGVTIGSNRRPVNPAGPADVSTSPHNSRTGSNLRYMTPAGHADVSTSPHNSRTGSNRRPVNPAGPAAVSTTPGDPGSADVSIGLESVRTRPISGSADGSVPVARRGTAMRLGDHILMEPAAAGRSRRLGAALSDERGDEPVRMSLMELLEESAERQAGALMYEEETEEAPATAPAEQKCCVCMIRHRGAAFIPCGHTFCRACSRELFLQRGNCPLCNAQISEILDIF